MKSIARICGVAVCAGLLAASASAEPKTFDLPHAGITGLKIADVSELYAGRDPATILSGAGGGVGFTLRGFASEAALDTLADKPALLRREAIDVKISSMKVDGHDGRLALSTLKKDGVAIGASVFWLGPDLGSKGRLIYELSFSGPIGMKTSTDAHERLARDAAGSLKMVEPKPLTELGKPAAEAGEEGSFEIRLPVGWTYARAEGDVKYAFAPWQMPGREPSPLRLQLRRESTRSKTDLGDRQQAAALLDRLKASAQAGGSEYLEGSSARLGPFPAVEYLMKRPKQGLVVRRVAIEGHFAVTLELQTASAEAKAAREQMAQLAATLQMPDDSELLSDVAYPQYECAECGEQFRMTLKQIQAQLEARGGVAMEEDPAEVPMDCRKCGKKKCALPMLQCPACEKWYVTEMTRAAHQGKDIEPFLTPDYVQKCPHCGKGHIEALKEKFKHAR